MDVARRQRSALDAEDLRWRFYVVVAALACLGQGVLALLDYRDPAVTHVLGREALFGALLCGLLLAVLLSRRLPLRVLDLGTNLAVTGALAAELWRAFLQPDPPPARLYFIGLFVVLSAFTVLPLRLAGTLVALIMATFGTLLFSRSGPHDPSLLIEMAVVVLLVLHLALFGRQISGERREGQHFRALALRDDLTGLDNRRAMYAQLEQAFAGRRAGVPFAVLLMDLDHFKRVNDEHGHEVGDRALQAVAQTLRAALRPQDGLARWGGEEFVALLPACDALQAARVAERLCTAVRDLQQPGLPRLTVSVGVSVAGAQDTVSLLLQRADAQLYVAKGAGRDRWQTAEYPAPDMAGCS